MESNEREPAEAAVPQAGPPVDPPAGPPARRPFVAAAVPPARTPPDPQDGPSAEPAAGDAVGAAADRPAGPPAGPAKPPRAPGIAGLSAPYRVVTALALAAVGLAACGHLALVFLHVAPSNTVSKQHARTVDDWIYPEFEQNWKLFAPNPLQQNIAVEVRAEVRTPGGEPVAGGWRDLSAQDGAAIRHTLLPSHTRQNELRRAWDFFTGSHGEDNKPIGERGELSEQYLRRIALNRLVEDGTARGEIVRIQLRSATRAVSAPPWSDEKTDTQTYYRELPWWTV
ncbi:hypothetical protein EDE04_3414 [Streptomyces sp. 2132.2]|uniref:DUF5819 family protein n=1 Tax=Streptomyces sp. 2132.2 TaxID=2485161 RepID=UPI000FB45239|nr:DUF5819 family protein [Streptomyces sp. 2132.2]ROQ96942.1 hypothetical protein EDE04_3414 [Streptomyces sp. 2132.2]